LKNSNWAPILEPFKRVFSNIENNFKHKSNISKEGKSQVDSLYKELENFSFNKTSNIDIKISRKIKRINLFELRYFKGSIKKFFSKVNLTGFKNFFNINKTNRVVGFTPDYVGIIPSRPVNFDNIYISFIKDNLNEIKNKTPILYESIIKSLVNFREVFSGSYDSNSGHLKNFLADDDNNTMKAIEILDLVKDCEWLKVPELDFSDFSCSVNWMNYNPFSNPGHYTSKLLSTKYKGNTIPYAFELAKRKFQLISTIPIKNYCLWDILAREKDINVSDFKVNKTPSTRVVLNTEHYETILLSYFFQPLMKAVDSFGKDIKFHISGEYNGEKLNSLHERISKYDFYVDADWSFFDASIDSEVLKAVGAIMFANSGRSKEDYRRFYHVISSFVTKYIVMPPGIVVELNRGNPSGHPGVTAVNCYTNIIRWVQIGKEIYGDKYQEFMDIEVYGDDAIVMFKYNEKLFKIDEIISNLGFKSDKLVEKIYPCKKFGIYENEGPDFLKRRPLLGVLSWNNDKMIDKLLYQSKKRTTLDQLNLLVNYMSTAPGNSEFNNLKEIFFNYFLNKYSDNDYIVNNLKILKDGLIKSDLGRFTQQTKSEKLYESEFKVMNNKLQILKDHYYEGPRKYRLNNDDLATMRLLFMINEYTYHPFRLDNIKNVKFKNLLYSILMKFSNTKKIFYRKGLIDTS
jgi:hypothetical protein